MKEFKRFFATLIVIAMSLMIVSCGGDSSGVENSSTVQSATKAFQIGAGAESYDTLKLAVKALQDKSNKASEIGAKAATESYTIKLNWDKTDAGATISGINAEVKLDFQGHVLTLEDGSEGIVISNTGKAVEIANGTVQVAEGATLKSGTTAVITASTDTTLSASINASNTDADAIVTTGGNFSIQGSAHITTQEDKKTIVATGSSVVKVNSSQVVLTGGLKLDGNSDVDLGDATLKLTQDIEKGIDCKFDVNPENIEPQNDNVHRDKIEEARHNHTFSSEWETDDDYHWRVSTCGHDVISGKTEHHFENDNICTICNMVNPSIRTISFDANGGSGEMSDITVLKDEEISMISSYFTAPEGMIFSEWSTEASGNGNNYKAGDLFTTSSDITLYAQWTIRVPNAKETPLTLEFVEDGILSFYGIRESLYYSTDGGETKIKVNGVIPVKNGDCISLFAEGERQTANYLRINCTSDCYVYGNVMSLIHPVDYATNTNLSSFDNAFRGLFQNNTFVRSHEIKELILPATELSDFCYSRMFSGCTSLSKAPELPATSLAPFCYLEMFRDCTSLSKAPELPALSLAYHCYEEMFRGCTSLSKAPELPATSLDSSCYAGMFNGCSSLTEAPELPATSMDEYCYWGMFSGCTSLFKAPELPALSLAYHCYAEMFSGCTSLTEAPVLPANHLASYCYFKMFFGCHNLNSIACFAVGDLADGSTNNWLYGVAQNGTFTKSVLKNDWDLGARGIPLGWSVVSM